MTEWPDKEKSTVTIKQVIIINRGTDPKMRRGKEIAQGAHAAMAFLCKAVTESRDQDFQGMVKDGARSVQLSEAAWRWIGGAFTKATLQVPDTATLQRYYEKAKTAGLEAHIIEDNGTTEFGGEPTKTAVAIGPDYAFKIDAVTGDLKLY